MTGRQRILRPEELTAIQWQRLVFDTLGNGAWGSLSRPVEAYTQILADSSLHLVVTGGFRGSAKSTAAAGIVPWYWLGNPHLKVLVLSEGRAKADAFAAQVYRLLNEMPELMHLRPRRGDRQRMSGFDLGIGSLEQQQSLTSIGIFGNTVGMRADIIICDDIEVPRTCETQGMREKLWARINDLYNLLRPEGPRRIIFLGTPHSDTSIYWRLVREKGYHMFLWPARYPTRDLQEYHGPNIHPWLREDLARDPSLVGRPTDERRFPEEILALNEAQAGGPAGIAKQYALDPRVTDAMRYPLKVCDLVTMDLDARRGPEMAVHSMLNPYPNVERWSTAFDGDRFMQPANAATMVFAPYEEKVIFVDPSGAGLDETAYIVTGWLNGQLCIIDWGGNTQWGPATAGYTDETLDRLVSIALENECSFMAIERTYASGMFSAMLQKHIRARGVQLGLHDMDVGGRAKEARVIAAIRPMLQQHRLILNARLIERDFVTGQDRGREAYRAIYQLTHISEERGALERDDRVDVLALACTFYEERAAIDAREALLRKEEQELDELYEVQAWPHGRPPGAGGFGSPRATDRVRLWDARTARERRQAPAVDLRGGVEQTGPSRPRRPSFDPSRLKYR